MNNKNTTKLQYPLAIDLAKEVIGEKWDKFDKEKQGRIINLIYEFAARHQAALEKQYTENLERIKSIAGEGINNITP